jgi:hypothetical protein
MVTWVLGLSVFGAEPCRAVTIGGWTPGIRALVGGRLLPCGCLTGRYETSSQELAEIVDAAGSHCASGHRTNAVLSLRRVSV